jgi:hypothetical protein
MPKAPQSEQEFLRVRTLARQILVEHGAAFAAGTAAVQTTEAADGVIGDLVRRYQPTLGRKTDRILEMITDADVARQMSDGHGAIMAAYGNAGYFLGVCTGLELASIVLGQALAVPARSRGKGGAK